MTTPVYDEQFLPRLVAIFFATFHPTEGPKVVYQVPEGSIAQEGDPNPSEADSNEAFDSDDEGEDFKGTVERRGSGIEEQLSNQEKERSASRNQLPSQQPSLAPVEEATTPSAASSFQTSFTESKPSTCDADFSSTDTEIGAGASQFTVLRDQGVSNFTIRDQPTSEFSSLDTLSIPVVSSSSSGGSESDDSDDGVSALARRRRLSRDSQGRPQVKAPSEASKAASAYSAAASQSRINPAASGLKPPEPLFDFSPLAEYVIPKAPLCGRLVTCTTKARAAAIPPEDAFSKSARSKARSGKSFSQSGSRASSVAPSSNAAPSIPDSPKSTSNELPRIPRPSNDPSSSRLVSSTYKVLSHPVLINDTQKYSRNTYIFNIGFVFDGRADTRAYEPIVRKCARVVRGLEVSILGFRTPSDPFRSY